ncbi:hypothetical protein B0H14DRAFT_2870282 [Mycena olivaceomarginata]|nr:hypothetical protein B0H14DRAFT_2870282 [Mycena olivaceomarginata]
MVSATWVGWHKLITFSTPSISGRTSKIIVSFAFIIVSNSVIICAVLVNTFNYYLQLLGPIENLPPGYLFLCPATDFGTDVTACFKVPTCPAYWSIDPSGAGRLSAEEARTLGFPDIDSWTEVRGTFCDSIVYGGVRQFHEAKGFDPDSQEVATHFGYPLFEVSCEQDDPGAHLQEIDSDDYYSGSEGVSDCEDHESISADAEDALVAEIALVFDAEMIGGLPVVPDAEMGSSGDLDGDNDVQEVALISLPERLEEEEVSAMLCC